MTNLAAEFMRQNSWANLTLIDFCEGLDDAILESSAPGTYGIVRETLVHMIGSLERYLARLNGRVPRQWATGAATEWPGFPQLRETATDAGGALEKLAESAAEDWELQGNFQGRGWRIKASVILVQAVNHCTDHRSQIATSLSQAGVTPPVLDSWAWGEASGRLVPL